MVYQRLLITTGAVLSLAACSSDNEADTQPPDGPEPVKVVTDDRTDGNPKAQSAGTSRFAEFECVSGAKPVTDLRSEADENGTVYYDPTGVTVFGLNAQAIERIDGGDEGVATYFADDRAALIAAIRTVHPDFRPERIQYSGGGYQGDDRFMSIGPATDGLIRFECLTYKYGGE